MTDCAICGGTGLYKVVVAGQPTHPANGTTGYCSCPAGRELFVGRVVALHGATNLPPRLQQATFKWYESNFAMSNEPGTLGRARLAAFMATRALAHTGRIDLRGKAQTYYGVGLTGPVGVGKTTLAAAAINAVVAQGIGARFYTVPDLLDQLRASLGDRRDDDPYPVLMDNLCKVPLLVLDDMGAEQERPWVVEKLYQIVNTRLETNRAIIFTSNAALPDPRQVEHGGWARIYRRLRDACSLYHLAEKE